MPLNEICDSNRKHVLKSTPRGFSSEAQRVLYVTDSFESTDYYHDTRQSSCMWSVTDRDVLHL